MRQVADTGKVLALALYVRIMSFVCLTVFKPNALMISQFQPFAVHLVSSRVLSKYRLAVRIVMCGASLLVTREFPAGSSKPARVTWP